ncbi:hypothetical protein E3V33_02870 [Candidatus Marinimicrobia bacterium MT.SAG.4]|nr:hypothetical protein E3V33_02870 [Candidatus Marinimicrobia bacterium MT.SAG.4]
MNDKSKSVLERFQQIQKREKSLEVWQSCESTFRIQENQNAVGALLIHGFGASPYEMKVLGEYLFREEFNVYSVRLSGHATNLKDFADSGMASWLSSTEEAYDIITEISSSTFIIGQSLGAAIALLLGPKVNPAGIVALSCILKFMDRKIKLTSYSVLRFLFPYKKMNVHPADIGYIYEKRPTSAISELLKVCKSLVKCLPNQKSPLLLMQAEDDSVIHPKSVEIIFNGAGSKVKETVKFKEGGHRLTLMPEPDRDLLFKKIGSFINAHS